MSTAILLVLAMLASAGLFCGICYAAICIREESQRQACARYWQQRARESKP